MGARWRFRIVEPEPAFGSVVFRRVGSHRAPVAFANSAKVENLDRIGCATMCVVYAIKQTPTYLLRAVFAAAPRMTRRLHMSRRVEPIAVADTINRLRVRDRIPFYLSLTRRRPQLA